MDYQGSTSALSPAGAALVGERNRFVPPPSAQREPASPESVSLSNAIFERLSRFNGLVERLASNADTLVGHEPSPVNAAPGRSDAGQTMPRHIRGKLDAMTEILDRLNDRLEHEITRIERFA